MTGKIEKEYFYTISGGKIIEKLIEDDHVAINHIILSKGDSIPEHYANSNVYLIITKGTMELRLGKQQPCAYSQGSILAIPYNNKMNGQNNDEDVLEFFVVKAPSPKKY